MPCRQKVVFRSLRAAAEAAVERLDKFGPQRAYRCDECPNYHLTTKPLHGIGSLTERMVRELAERVGRRAA